MAGRNVTAAHTATRTTSAAERPSEVTSGIPAKISESSAMTTVLPANTTALPDVATERAIASLGSSPRPVVSM